jgi:hypothetical protein
MGVERSSVAALPISSRSWQMRWGSCWCMGDTQAKRRARGVQQSREGGTPVWATSGPNWTLVQKQSLLSPSCTTTLIKRAKSLDQQIRR